MVVKYYPESLSLKFHEDPNFCCGDIGKIKLTFCNQLFSMHFLQHSSKRIFFGMSIDVFHGLTSLKGIYIHQMSCIRDDFSAKISLKEDVCQDLIGV